MTYAAGILYRCGNAVLLLLRGGDCDHPNTWGLPGGKIEEGETAMAAAIRESQEETGFAPDPRTLRVLEQTDHFGTFGTFGTTLAQQFVPVLNSEHRGYVWAPLDALPAPIHPGLAPLLLGLQTMTAEDTASARSYDGNGWYEVKKNPISRVGIFPYSGAQLGLQGDDAERIFQVLRPPEELSDPECIASFKLLPWIDNHAMLGPAAQAMTDAALPAEAKGVHGVIGEQVFFEDGVLYGNIKTFSDHLADLIDAGKRELSAGYRCVYDMVSGIFNGQHYDCVQRQIRGNHLALVKEGRMGPGVAVMDHLTFSFDAKEITMPADNKDGKDGATAGEPSLADAIKMLGEIAPQVAALNAAVAKLSATPATPAVTDGTKPADAAAAVTEAVEDKKDFAAMDASLKEAHAALADMKTNGTRTFLKAVAERDALVTRLVPHVGAFDHALMTRDEVAVYGCEKLKINAPKEAAVYALDAFLQANPGHSPASHAEFAQDGAPVKPTSFVDGILAGAAAK
jgi:8-oxo-dGTP pyrophosphatase MutT (NUDIX family)